MSDDTNAFGGKPVDVTGGMDSAEYVRMLRNGDEPMPPTWRAEDRDYQEQRAGRLWSDALGVTFAHRHSEQVRFDRRWTL